MPSPLIDLRHPTYASDAYDWYKWRLTYEGGRRFRDQYLEKFTTREEDGDFLRRRSLTYVPAFAKAAVNEVRNAIFQRLVDITRDGGSTSYHDAIDGLNGGVDLEGSTMNTFMGREILTELITMKRVGIYTDMPSLPRGPTRVDARNKRPYIYKYKTEDILAWTRIQGSEGTPTEFLSLLLRDNGYEFDEDYYLPYGFSSKYRYLYIDDDGYVRVKFFDKEGEILYPNNYDETGEDTIRLDLRRIPFTMLELSDSLLADVCDYQIALMNLCSSDLAYILKSNYPFYTEQSDMATMMPYLKQVNTVTGTNTVIDPTTTTITQTADNIQQILLGTSQGRRYPKGLERPGFIAPPSEPLMASMEKEKQMKDEIRELVMLAVSNLTTQRQSADSKDADDDGLEAGLSYIGIELQRAERQICEFWAAYEGSQDVATVHYPDNYSLLSDDERREAAAALKDLMPMVPSLTFRKEVAKRIARVTIGTKIDRKTMRKIEKEIDSAEVVMGDPADIEKDVTNGICDPDTAATARGYPEGTAKKAEEANARKLAQIAAHQSKPNVGGDNGDPASRGIKVASADPQAPKKEKFASQKDHTTDVSTKDKTRGTTT